MQRKKGLNSRTTERMRNAHLGVHFLINPANDASLCTFLETIIPVAGIRFRLEIETTNWITGVQ